MGYNDSFNELLNIIEEFKKYNKVLIPKIDDLIKISYSKEYFDIYTEALSIKSIYFLRSTQFEEAKKAIDLLNNQLLLKDNNYLLNYYNLLGMYYWHCNQQFDKALEILSKGHTLVENQLITNLKFEYYNYHLLGVIYCSKHNYINGYQNLLKASKYKLEKKDEYLKVMTYNWLGIIESVNEDYKNALSYYDKAAKILNKNSMFATYADLLNSIGLIYLDLNKMNFAKEAFAESIDLSKKYKIYEILADAYNNYGLVFKEEKDFQMAETYFSKSLEIREKSKNLIKKSYTMFNYGVLKFYQKEYAEAETLFFKTIRNAKKNNDIIFITKSYSKLIDMYLSLNDTTKALQYLKLSEKIFNENMKNNKDYSSSEYAFFLKIYALYYKNKKQFKKAFAYFEKFHNVNEKITNFEVNMKAELYHLKTEIEKIRLDYNNKLDKEKLNAVLAMAVTANHEINQPLTVMQTAIDILNNLDCNQMNIDKQKKYLDKIAYSIEDINQILIKFRTNSNIKFDSYLNDKIKMVTFNS